MIPQPNVDVVGSEKARLRVPRSHKNIEGLVLLLFWLLLLEGILRKWVLPQASQILFFIRDPVVLVVYLLALRANVFRKGGVFLLGGVVFAVVGVLLGFAQTASTGKPEMLILAGYGWRQYFLYLPLSFVIARVFTIESIMRFARHALVAISLAAPLVILQSLSPPDSIVNRGAAEDEAQQFQSFSLAEDKIRPGGPFASAAGMKEFIASSLALVLALWLSPRKERHCSSMILILGTVGTACCLAVSGSRGAFVHCAIVLACAVLIGFLSRFSKTRWRALGMPVTLVVIGSFLYPIVFPDAMQTMLDRAKRAQQFEEQFSSYGILGRALLETVDFIGFLGRAPLTGYGLGLGTNARRILESSNPQLLAEAAAESDWSRHIVDLGPAIGVAFIAYRIAFFLSLANRTFRAARRTSFPFPLLLFGYVGVQLFYGQITGNGIVGGFHVVVPWALSCRLRSRIGDPSSQRNNRTMATHEARSWRFT